jgi:hypothetical protein
MRKRTERRGNSLEEIAFLNKSTGRKGVRGRIPGGKVESFSSPRCLSVDCATHARSFTQAEVEGSSFVDLRFSPDASTVLSDDALHRGESDTGAFKLLVAVKPLKCSKRLVGVLRVESCAVVPDEKHKLALDC